VVDLVDLLVPPEDELVLDALQLLSQSQHFIFFFLDHAGLAVLVRLNLFREIAQQSLFLFL
jgi:hypothetical protein